MNCINFFEYPNFLLSKDSARSCDSNVFSESLLMGANSTQDWGEICVWKDEANAREECASWDLCDRLLKLPVDGINYFIPYNMSQTTRYDEHSYETGEGLRSCNIVY